MEDTEDDKYQKANGMEAALTLQPRPQTSPPVFSSSFPSSSSSRPRHRRSSSLPSSSRPAASGWWQRLPLRSVILLTMLCALLLLVSAWCALVVHAPLERISSGLTFRSRFNLYFARSQTAALASPRASSPQSASLSSAPSRVSAPSPFTAHDVTYVTVFQPEPVVRVQLSRTKSRTVDHQAALHHLYALDRLSVRDEQLLVFVSQLDDCRLLAAFPIAYSCRLSSCFSPLSSSLDPSSPPASSAYLRCLLEEAEQKASSTLLLFAEQHVLLFSDLLPALLRVANSLPAFLLAGTTRSTGLKDEGGLSPKLWHEEMQQAVLESATTAERRDDGDEDAAAEQQRGNSSIPHWFGWRRGQLPLSSLSPQLLMGGGDSAGHHWEQHLLSSVLVDGRVKVVDASDAVVAVDLMHDPGGAQQSIDEWNDRAGAGRDRVQLGRLQNAHYLLTGRCPTCLLKENREADLPLILLRQSGASRSIIVIAVNSEYLSLAANWICRANSLRITNYILLAEDRLAYRVLRRMDIPAILPAAAPYLQPSGPPGSLAFQRRSYLLALYLQRMLALGYDTTLLDLSVLLLSPLALQWEPQCEAHAMLRSGQMESSLVLHMRSGAKGERFAADLLQCESDDLEFMAAHGNSRFVYSDEASNSCLHFVMKRMRRRLGMNRCVLSAPLWQQQQAFLALEGQERGSYPLAVVLEGGVEEQVQLMRAWRLWRVDELETMTRLVQSGRGEQRPQLLQCQAERRLQPPAPTFDDRHSFRLSINVLASTSPAALQSTLTSIASAFASASPSSPLSPAAIPVDLVITVQQPDTDTMSNTQQLLSTTRTAEQQAWPHGEKRILYLAEHLGPAAVMADWAAREDDSDDAQQEKEADDEEVLRLALEAGTVLSSQWLHWLTAALNSFHFDPFQYDAQLMGIHLMHQFSIVGETPAARFGSRIPSSVLNGSLLYQYQLVPLFGTVFFPQHLQAFLQWYQHRSVSPSAVTANGSVACVPTLVSNRWFLSDPVTHWSQWLHRFTFETGWYALYSNWQAAQGWKGRALAVKDAVADRAGGGVAGEGVVELVRRLKPAELEMPQPAAIPLFDFHFNRADGERSALALRQELFPPLVETERTAEWRGEGSAIALVMDAMRLAVVAASSSSSSAVPDTDDGAAASADPELSRAYAEVRRLSLLPPPPPPASATSHSRCAVLDDTAIAASSPSSLSLGADATASLPFPFNASFTLSELFLHVYETGMKQLPITASSSARFVVYRPTTAVVPFDRHLRGLYFAFVLSLVTERMLLIDLPDFESMFDCPLPGVVWSWSAFRQRLPRNVSSAVFDAGVLSRLHGKGGLSVVYEQQVLFHTDAVTHDRLLFASAAYRSHSLAIFGTSSRMKRAGMAMRLLQSRPKPALVTQVRALQKQLALPAVKYSVCVHLRGGEQARKGGVNDPLPLSAAHWECVQSLLLHLGWNRQDVRLVVSSDSPYDSSAAVAEQRLSLYGTVVHNKALYSAASNWGMGNATVRASAGRDALSGSLVYDPYIVNHFVLGDCDVSISSGTTYGIFGAARTGFSKRAYVYRSAPPPVKGKDGKLTASDEPDYCGPMHRIDLPNENDIIF